jgi:alkanesulfonate monooxygenase SsuD/methylene tetrahydromethanopterin reductase-like flavin-dependent oxidoreductase (luciferase family)
VADQVLARTQRLGVLLAHRPGFVAPTYAARKFATLDAFHPGRVALHVITGGDDAERAQGARKFFNLDHSQQHGSQRLLEFAAQGDVHDERLWTPIAKVTGAAGNSTALVGSYEQVAQALLRYVDLGVSTLLIRGFTPLADARDYGTLVRLVREQADPARLVSAR